MPYRTPALMQEMEKARAAGASHFIDPETKAVISFDPQTGEMHPFGLWIRTLRLQQKAQGARWWRRLRHAIARSLGRDRVPAPDRPRQNFNITGDKEHD